MGKRVRLTESTNAILRLKTNKISLNDIEERSNVGKKLKGRSIEYQIMSFDKMKIASLLEDFKTMRAQLKRLGVVTKLTLHVSETDAWKKTMSKPLKDEDVPSFLRKDRK